MTMSWVLDMLWAKCLQPTRQGCPGDGWEIPLLEI